MWSVPSIFSLILNIGASFISFFKKKERIKRLAETLHYLYRRFVKESDGNIVNWESSENLVHQNCSFSRRKPLPSKIKPRRCQRTSFIFAIGSFCIFLINLESFLTHLTFLVSCATAFISVIWWSNIRLSPKSRRLWTIKTCRKI